MELITVVAIMGIIMSLSVMSVVGIRRGAEMRSGVSTVRTVLSLSRQHAVTKREKVYVSFLNQGTYVVSNAMGLIGETNFLPPGVMFTNFTGFPPGYQTPPTLVFTPAGGAISAVSPKFTIKEVAGSAASEITVYGLTGVTAVNEL